MVHAHPNLEKKVVLGIKSGRNRGLDNYIFKYIFSFAIFLETEETIGFKCCTGASCKIIAFQREKGRKTKNGRVLKRKYME